MVGRGIAKPTTDIESSEDERVDSSTSKENLDTKYDDLPEPTGKNVVEQTSVNNQIGQTTATKPTGSLTSTADNKDENLIAKTLTSSQTTVKDDLKKNRGCQDRESGLALTKNVSTKYDHCFSILQIEFFYFRYKIVDVHCQAILNSNSSGPLFELGSGPTRP